jgi:hypothetical protein
MIDKGVEQVHDLPEFWKRNCLLGHQTCRDTTQTQVILPTRLLSISENEVRLIYTSGWAKPLDYATLSHCWGGATFLCLKTTNLNILASGIDWSDLTETFRDAIAIARRAGLGFIWIDSLCIIQDSHSDWQRESAQMGSIYRGSSLNIAAASAINGTQGCFLQQPLSRTISAFRLPSADDDTLLQNPGTSESYDLHRNHLETRAWCLQELILAPRTLYCTDKGLFWECKKQFATADLQTLSDHRSSLPDVRAITTVVQWMRRIVGRYSECNLTFSRDKLPALDGIAKIMQPIIGSNYHAGLWRSQIELQLCWFARERRIRPPYRGAPSWSWASVDGPISLYPRTNRKQKKPFKSSFVTIVHEVIVKPAHRNAFGELEMGRLQINCSKLVVGHYQWEEQHDAHQVVICNSGRDGEFPRREDMPREKFQFRPDSLPGGTADHNSEAAGAAMKQATCEVGGRLVMLPLGSMVGFGSLQGNEKDRIYEKSTYGLVLEPVASRRGEYTRLGSFECVSSHGIGHKYLHERDDGARFARILRSSGAEMARAACAKVLNEPKHKRAQYQLEVV